MKAERFAAYRAEVGELLERFDVRIRAERRELVAKRGERPRIAMEMEERPHQRGGRRVVAADDEGPKLVDQLFFPERFAVLVTRIHEEAQDVLEPGGAATTSIADLFGEEV